VELGVFLPTTNNGYVFSTASPQFLPSYALNKQVCLDAEAGGFDFALSMVKYRGYGDGDGFWDYAVESLSVMGPLVEATSRLRLWASVGALSMHPAMAARMATTLSEASGGRFGLNVVAGWNKAEYAQMGMWPAEGYETARWRFVEEYVDVMRGLWHTGRLTHHGEFFDLEDCLLQPGPTSPVTVVVPGQSANTVGMAARVADVNFILGDFEEMAQARRDLVAATAGAGRSVRSSGLLGIVMAPTDAGAAELAEHYMRHTDLQARAGLMAAASGDVGKAASRYLTQEDVPAIVFDHPTRAAVVSGACWYQHHLVGSYERVAAYLDDLETQADVTSCVLSFPDYENDLTTFAREVMPRMRTANVPV
jgi:pyrimidine oxygenase